MLEIVRARWGTVPHLVFLVFCLATNFIVTSMLILGGASVVTALSGGVSFGPNGRADGRGPKID